MQKANKNFNISLQTALQQNLLGVLAGDVAYKIGAGAGLHLRFRKDKLVDSQPSEEGEIQQWMMTIDEVVFTDRDGDHHTEVDGEIQSLITAWNLEEEEEHTDSHVYLRFVAGDEGLQFAHQALVELLSWETPHVDRLHWRGLLRKEQITANVTSFANALELAFREKFVSLIIHQQPNETPDFLPAAEL